MKTIRNVGRLAIFYLERINALERIVENVHVSKLKESLRHTQTKLVNIFTTFIQQYYSPDDFLKDNFKNLMILLIYFTIKIQFKQR